jgi:PAS domain S-box-containing protein
MSKTKILIVEDEKIIAKDLEIRLRNMNYEVIASVTNGADAINVVRTTPPDLILMDIMIDGDIDGIETTELIHQERDVPVIYLTAYADDKTFQRAKLSDPFGYILKPFQDRELDITIQTILRKHGLELRLIDSERQYKLLFENNPMPMWIFDVESLQILAVNETAVSVFGYSKEEFLEMTLLDLGPSAPHEAEEYSKAIQNDSNNQGSAGTWMHKTKHGDWLYIDVVSQKQVFKGHDARIMLLNDVTEKIHAQAEIRNLAKFPSEAPNPIFRVTTQGKIVYANAAAEQLVKNWQLADEQFLPAELVAITQQLNEENRQQYTDIQVGSEVYSLLLVYIPEASYINIYARDITRQRQSEVVINYQKDIFEMIAKEASIQKIFRQICMKVQELNPASAVAVLIIDSQKGAVQSVTAPTLPDTYINIIKGLSIGPKAGSSGTAAFLKKPVIVSDIDLSPLWEGYREKAHDHGIKACWSTPVFDKHGDVIAALTMYYYDEHTPQEEEFNLINVACNLVSIALERDRSYESLYKQALTFENISDAVVISDLDDQIREWSPSAEKMFGFERHDILGKPISSLIPGTQTMQNGNLQLSSILLTQSKWTGELPFVTSRGQEGIAEITAVLLRDRSGQNIGILRVLRDVTHKKLSEKNLRESEERFSKVFASNPAAIAISHFETGLFVDVNTSFETLTGYSKDFITSFEAHEVKLWSDASQLQQAMARLSQGETVHNIDAQLITHNGQTRAVLVSLERIMIGEDYFTVAMINDVSEQKKAEEALLKSEVYYKTLIQNSTDLVSIIDKEGVVTYDSPSISVLLGYDENELTGKSLFDFVHPEDHQQVQAMFTMPPADPKGFVPSIDFRFKHKNGEWRFFESQSSNLLHDPNISGIVINSRDITDRKLIENALSRSEASLKAIFDNTVQCFVLIDTNYHIQTFNRMAKQLAYSLTGTALQTNVSALGYVYESKLDKFKDMFQRAVQGEYIAFETYLETPFDVGYWLEISFLPVYDAQMKITNICFTVLNIQDRKNTELVLAASEARFRSLAQNSSDIITVLNSDGFITYNSESAERLIGFTSAELLSRKAFEFVHPDDLKAVQNVLEEVSLEAGKIITIEYRFRHAQGHYVYIETSFSNLLQEPAVNGIVMNSRETTERKLQEENMQLLQRAIDASKNGVIISDSTQPGHPVIYANKAFNSATGDGLYNTLHKLYAEHNTSERQQEQLALLRSSINQQTECSVLLRDTAQDGKSTWYELNVSPIYNGDSRLTNYIGILNDITERKRAEDTLKNIVKGVSGSIGKEFFMSLVENLAAYLQVSHAVISEVVTEGNEDNKLLKTIAVYHEGEIVENYEIPLQGTPAENVLTHGLYHSEHIEADYSSGLITSSEQQYKTYLGISLKESTGKTLGILSVMHKQELPNLQIAESILQIFSARAAAELERIFTLRALFESQANLSALIENTSDIIWAIDKDYRLIAQNSAFKQQCRSILGFEWELYENVFERLSPEMTRKIKGYYSKAMDGDRFSKEFSIELNSHLVNYDVSFNPIFTEDNQISGISVFARDITERKKAEEELRQSEVNLTTLIENTDDIIYSLDKQLRLTTANSAFKELCKDGFQTEIEPGCKIDEVIPEEFRENWKEHYAQVMQGERFTKEVHYESNDFAVDLEISYNPIFTEEGQVNGLSVFGRDITQRKLSENELKRTNFELDSFVYRASHDLRAPLRSVLGLINLARLEPDAEQRNMYLKLVEKSINKLDSFILDLTNFSRNSRLDIEVQEIDFRAIISECINNLRYMDHADKIKCTINTDQGYPFYSDITRITIVFQNMISNAVKYQRVEADNSYVEINIKTHEEWADIEVRDNGRGIQKEYLEKIFDMFFRASEDSYGSGLGLYITKQVIEKLQGNLVVESQVNVGTSFRIRLPNLAHKELPENVERH